MHILNFLLLLLLFPINSVAHPKNTVFTIAGSINAAAGKMIQMPANFNQYYPTKIDQETEVIKGKFKFKNAIPYPYPFRLGLKINAQWKYISGVFFIEPGNQFILCSIDSNRKIPEIVNKTMQEYQNEYLSALSNLQLTNSVLHKRKDSLQKIFGDTIPALLTSILSKEKLQIAVDKDSTILHFIKTHPESFVSMWQLVDKLAQGYTPFLNVAYNYLSPSIKNTFSGKLLFKKIQIAKSISTGNLFPPVYLKNNRGKPKVLPSFKNTNYTLINFWYSHCGPCVAQFPLLKNIYNKYKIIFFLL